MRLRLRQENWHQNWHWRSASMTPWPGLEPALGGELSPPRVASSGRPRVPIDTRPRPTSHDRYRPPRPHHLGAHPGPIYESRRPRLKPPAVRTAGVDTTGTAYPGARPLSYFASTTQISH